MILLSQLPLTAGQKKDILAVYNHRREGRATETKTIRSMLNARASETLSATALLSLRRREPESCLVYASWAALEPAEGRLDPEALAELRERLLRIGALGIEPVLCLYRGEDPDWYAARGGWEKEDNLRCYLRYAGKLVRAVGHLASEYVTFFEPNELAWSRGGRDLRRSLVTLSHMACVHARAYRLIRDTRTQRGLGDTRVGVVLRAVPAGRLRRELLLFKSPAAPGAYEKLPLLAMTRGEFRLPLRNTLRIRPGAYCDFVGLHCRREERDRCRAEMAAMTDVPLRDVPDQDREG